MPAEWEPHAGCYLVWPERPDNWRLRRQAGAGGLGPGRRGHRVGRRRSPCSRPYGQWANARAALPADVRVVETTTNDAWVRDSGPTLPRSTTAAGSGRRLGVQRLGRLRAGCTSPGTRDDIVGSKIAELERATYWTSDLVLEGGSIDVDGEGTLLTTEECLLNPNRNPDRTREEIEAVLGDHLGVDRVDLAPRWASSTTRPTATSTTSRASWRPAWSS